MLRVMTLNLNYYVDQHGAWDDRRTAIVDAVRKADPDILALQAVRREPELYGGQDQAIQLSHALGGYPHVAFQPAEASPQEVQMGNAILARIPIGKVEQLKLSLRDDSEDRTRRVLQSACFERPGGSFYVFNAHFSWVEQQLEDNVNETLPFIRAAPDPALLIGDMNSPASPGAAGQGGLYLLEEAGWIDAWAQLRPDEPGYTFEAGNPSIRIDYAWANPKAAPLLRRIEIVGEGGPDLSDHLGLVVELEF